MGKSKKSGPNPVLTHVQEPSQTEADLSNLARFSDENPDPILRVSREGNLLYANKRALDLLSQFGKQIHTHLTKDWRSAIEDVLHTQTSKTVETVLGERIILFTIAHFGDAHYAYLYGQDITERKKLDQLKDEFISNVSHELRIPLTIVKGAVSNLKDGVVGPLTEKQQEIIQVAGRNIDRLQRLMTDLLDLSRLESGKARVHFREIDLAELLKETAKNFQMAVERKYLSLVVTSSSPLASVYADLDMIHQVLNNLLDNALRYAKKKISLEACEEDDQHMRLTVRDDGSGIDKKNLEIIFEKFKQLQRSGGGPGYKGTGLGLAICREILHRHNGRIWAESESGKGAIFHVTLPKYNERANFWTALESACVGAKEHATSLSLLGLTVTNMTELKKQYGERELQRRMQELKERVHRQFVRKEDELFQYDGQFVLILSETQRQNALAVGRRVQETLEESLEDLRLQVRMASFPDDAAGPKQLLERIGIDA